MPGNTHKPLLLVDVDGVLSLYGRDLDIRSGGRWHMVDGTPHFLSHPAAEHLRALAAVYALAWCSGWGERANDHLPYALSLPGPLPFVTFPEPVGRATHWKLSGIDAFAGPDRALAWIDDDLDDACAAWARRRPGPTLLVPTDPVRGLTAGEAAILRAWPPAAA